MKESLRDKQSFVVVAYAMPLDETVETPDAGVLKKFMGEGVGMLSGKENLMPITALGDHDELEAAINSVVFGLEDRMRDEIHQFADSYMEQWRDQWPHYQRPWWWAGRHLEELSITSDDWEEAMATMRPTKALMMRIAAGAYLRPVNSQEEAQAMPDPGVKGLTMCMTFNEEKDLDDVARGAERTFWMLRSEMARYFFKPLKSVLGEERVATLLKKYGREVE